MEVLNVNIQLSFDEDKLKKANIESIDDLKSRILLYDDILDSFILVIDTSDIKNDKYLIENASITSITDTKKEKTRKLNRMNDILSSSLNELHDELLQVDSYKDLNISMLSTITEITSIIYSAINLTDLTEFDINTNVLDEYNITYDELLMIENRLLSRL